MENLPLNKLFKLIFHFSLILLVFFLTRQDTKAQIYDGTYTGTVSGSILQSEYDDNLYGGKIRNKTTFKQIVFKVATKNGLEIEGEMSGEWKSVSTVQGEKEKKDWSYEVICRNYSKSGGILPSDKSLNFSCVSHAYLDLIILEGTISNGEIKGKWQTKAQPSVSGTFQAVNSNHSISLPKPENKIDSRVRFGSVNGQIEVWYENENDSKIAKIDTVLYEGAHIKTEEDATCILVFGDMSNFVMKPETHIILAKTSGPESKIKLVIGNIIANVKKMIKDGTMEVDMSQGVAGIKGTTFEVWEDSRRKESTLRVEEGTVEFRHKVTGKTMLVTARQKVMATSTGFTPVQANPNDTSSKVTSLEGNWNGFFNGSPVVMEITKRGNQYGIRFNVGGNPWEEMLDVKVSRNNISFRRVVPGWEQIYTGIIGNGSMEGIFSQNGSGKYVWSAKRAGSNEVQNINGQWKGSWTNSKGESGTSIITIKEADGGIINGNEDGYQIVNGRRLGNILTWQYRKEGNGCRDYDIQIQLASDGKSFSGTYQATNRCASPATYTGKYLNYKK